MRVCIQFYLIFYIVMAGLLLFCREKPMVLISFFVFEIRPERKLNIHALKPYLFVLKE